MGIRNENMQCSEQELARCSAFISLLQQGRPALMKLKPWEADHLRGLFDHWRHYHERNAARYIAADVADSGAIRWAFTGKK
jgi:hypothetical protein